MPDISDIVIIGNHTQGLGILRSAAEVNCRIFVVNDVFISLTRFSKYIDSYIKLPGNTLKKIDQKKNEKQLLSALLNINVRKDSLLFPVNEDIIRFIYNHKTVLSQKFFIPDVNLDVIYNKYKFNHILPVHCKIETHFADVDQSKLSTQKKYIVKGAEGMKFRQATSKKAISYREYSKKKNSKPYIDFKDKSLIIQELILSNKPVVSVCCFSIKGKIQSYFQYQKIRQHPDQFGTGTYLKSIRNDKFLFDTEEILKTLNYTGISEIEFIWDENDKKYKVIEMNPRTWKSVHFATRCGNNLVEKYLKWISQKKVQMESEYQENKYWVDLATDIPQMLREKRLFKYHKEFYECTWYREDPLPGILLWTLFPLLALKI